MDKRQQAEQVQKSVIKAVNTIVENKLSMLNTTMSLIGVVVENPIGFNIKVRIGEDVHDCTLGEHLHHWIQKDDVVMVQDLYNDRKNMTVIEKTGHINPNAQLVFEDPRVEGNHVSGVDGVFNEEGELINYSIVDPEGYGPQAPHNTPTQQLELIHEVVNPVTTFSVIHSLGKKYPNVIVVNTEGVSVLAEIQYVSDTKVTVSFSSSFIGKIILN